MRRPGWGMALSVDHRLFIACIFARWGPGLAGVARNNRDYDDIEACDESGGGRTVLFDSKIGCLPKGASLRYNGGGMVGGLILEGASPQVCGHGHAAC